MKKIIAMVFCVVLMMTFVPIVSAIVSMSGNAPQNISVGVTLAVAEGSTLTVPETQLTTNDGTIIVHGTLQINGHLVNNGAVVNYGVIVNEGEISGNGEIIDNEDVIDSDPTLFIFAKWHYEPSVDNLTLSIVGYHGDETNVEIPDEIDGLPVVNISGFTFQNDGDVVSVTIPESVTIISGFAFSGCESLESVSIPESVTTIENFALKDCSNLTIYGIVGSYAETYAKENNIKFIDPFVSANDWARDSIKTAIVKGFVPVNIQDDYTNVITRAEFCRMAVRFVEYGTGKSIDEVLLEKDVSRTPSAFSDTEDPDILAAYALGITAGTMAPTDTTHGEFTPDGEFNRQQAATMLMRVCGVIGMDVDNMPNSEFSDLGEADIWAVEGINFCYANEIMIGTGNNNFSPKEAYTRQQSIMTFDRIK